MLIDLNVYECYDYFRRAFEDRNIPKYEALAMLKVFEEIQAELQHLTLSEFQPFDLIGYLGEYSLHPFTFEGLKNYHYLLDDLDDLSDRSEILKTQLIEILSEHTYIYPCGEFNEYVLVQDF